MNKKNFLGLVALSMLTLSLSSCTKTVYVPQSPYNNNMATMQQGAANNNTQSLYNANNDNSDKYNTSLIDRVNDNKYPAPARPEQRTPINANNQTYVRPVNPVRNTAPNNNGYTAQTNTSVNVTNAPSDPRQTYQYPSTQPVNTTSYPVQNRPNKAPVPPQPNSQYPATTTEPVTIASYTAQRANNTPVVQQDYQYPNAPKPKNVSGYATQNNNNQVVQQDYQYPNAPKPKNAKGYATQQSNNYSPAVQQDYQYPNAPKPKNAKGYATQQNSNQQIAPVQIEQQEPFSQFYGQRVTIFFKNGAKLDGSIAKHPENKNKVVITLADRSVYESLTKDIDRVEYKK